MMELNYLAVVVAVVAALVVSVLWYTVFGKQLEALGSGAANVSRSPALVMLVELVRSLVVAVVVAGLAAQLEITSWTGAVGLGLALWIGFPVVLLAGSVFHERVPWKLAAVHSGDWLVKLIMIAVLVGVWH